jgi:hypothetical protein
MCIKGRICNSHGVCRIASGTSMDGPGPLVNAWPGKRLMALNYCAQQHGSNLQPKSLTKHCVAQTVFRSVYRHLQLEEWKHILLPDENQTKPPSTRCTVPVTACTQPPDHEQGHTVEPTEGLVKAHAVSHCHHAHLIRPTVKLITQHLPPTKQAMLTTNK